MNIPTNEDTLIRDRVMIEWVALGEGVCGYYNPSDPDDIELLRFDVSWFGNDGVWVDPGDASYCTRFPVNATVEQKSKGLNILMEAVYSPLINGHSIKKICEQLSWISLDDL